jgi:formylglycine-generating enzyme required for sulfatase activity/tRNA A-37 threonylcarbamoyl transferase component Bud32
VEDYLRHLPGLERDPEALLDLLAAEIQAREEHGEASRLEEYVRRFPQLAAELRRHFAARQALAGGGLLDHPAPPTLAPQAAVPSEVPTLSPTPQSGAPPDGPRLPPPTGPGELGLTGYELLEEIGRGGMGVVYKARHFALNRIVAVKMILHGAQARPDELLRFLTEAEAAAQLQHPNIAQVYEIGRHHGQPYFALEYVEGGSLDQLLNGTPLPARAAAELVARLAGAVQVAHDHGIVHRDLKPANVLLTRDRVPKVTDFGLAKRVAAGTALTESGAILGTPSYMAPEQAGGHGKAAGPAADVYALGAILYECLTGRPPFRAATPVDTLLQVLENEPVPPRQLQPRLPRDLETICLKCLHKQPGRRYASAAALADDLGRFLAGEPIQARPVGRLERAVKWARRRPTAAALLAVALLVVIGAGVGTAWYNAEQRQRTAAALVRALASADTIQAPRLVEELANYRTLAAPLLDGLAEQSAPDSPARLHAALARAALGGVDVDFLAERLLTAAPEQVPVIRDALRPHGAAVVGRFWAVLDDARAESGPRLRAAAALAALEPLSPRWDKAGGDLVNRLVAENPLHLGLWTEALRPVGPALLDPLAAVFRDPQRPEGERSITTNLLADYAADRPDLLYDLASEADARSFAVLWPRLRAHREVTLTRANAELDRVLAPDWKDGPPDPAWAAVPAGVAAQVEAAEGLVAERFALCQALPPEELAAVADGLSRAGYRLVNLRPYSPDAGAHQVPPGTPDLPVRVAALWRRDGREARHAVGLTAEAAAKQQVAWREQGFLPLDVAAYRVAGLVRYALVAARPDAGLLDARLYLGIVATGHGAVWQPLQKRGYVPRTVVQLEMGEAAYYSGVWWKPARPREDAAGWNQSEGTYEEQLSPGRLQLDVRLLVSPARVRRTQQEAVALWGLAPGAGAAGLSWGALWQVQQRQEDGTPGHLYSQVSTESPDYVSVDLHGLAPAAHRKRCRDLAAQGYRPVALALAPAGGPAGIPDLPAPRVAASVWHRPVVPEAAREALARRQAQAAVLLLRLGRAERVWPLLRSGPDPRLRTWVIHKLSPLGSDPQTLLARLEAERDVSIRRALLLSLGGFCEAQLPAAARQALVPRLLRLYRDDPDPGLHAAAEWLLRRWGQTGELHRADRELARRAQPPAAGEGGRRWLVAREGHTLVVFPGPVTFWMGSPASESERYPPNELLHRRRIPRSFALATKEVTVEQFQRFLKANPAVRHSYLPRYSPDPNGPIIWVTWYEAAQYCRWLSEQEKIPGAEMCYPPIPQIREGMRLPVDYLSRTGYRLPTEAEWEYACRAETTTSRFYGAAAELLPEYAWFQGNSQDRAWPVGQVKPNDWGLFDLYGNAAEWCSVVSWGYRLAGGDRLFDDKDSDLILHENPGRALRGGSYGSAAAVVRSADHSGLTPASRNGTVGLRVARTYP